MRRGGLVTVVEIVREPREERYAGLLDFCAEYCSKFLLVVREGGLSVEGQAVLADLEPFLLGKRRGYDWPGMGFEDDATKGRYEALCPPEHAPTILTYRLDENSKRYLKTAVDGLYDWRQPRRPEDLCLLREDETPFLVSIVPDNIAYVELGGGLEQQVRSGLIRMGLEINGEEPDLDLTPDESAGVDQVVADLSRDLGYKPDLYGVLCAWRDFVAQVERGYDQPLKEYTYDLEVRDLLESILENVRGCTHRKLALWLSYWDERFDKATREGGGPLTPQATKERQPWWFRIPRDLGAELEADLMSKGLL
jgi:hypothetical protein